MAVVDKTADRLRARRWCQSTVQLSVWCGLADEVTGWLSAGPLRNELAQRVTEFEPDADLIQRFLRDFRDAGRPSLDAFVESRTEFVRLIKHAIALTLTPKEIEDNLFPSQTTDWYRYLLNDIIPGSIAGFRQNQLRVITFNFDRSFERRLVIALGAA